METRVRTSNAVRVCQGDIFKDVEMIEYAVERFGDLEISKIVFPLVVVLSQDCDLSQDHKHRWSRNGTSTQDKWLISVLVAPMYNVEHVYAGTHLSQLDMKMEPINKNRTPGKSLVRNERPRYHYLSFSEEQPIVDSVIDFKHFFTVNGKYLRKLRNKQFVCRVAPLYRENISQRFSSYLSRIGLPD